VLLVVNPVSRRGLKGEREARDAFTSAGIACAVVHTAGTGDAARLTRDFAQSHDAVFTLGGDGTAMEVVGALIGSDKPVGILAGGTANQVARYLQTPLSIRRAVPALLAGTAVRLDLGRLGPDRCFALIAGFGMDAAMMMGASARSKKRFGVGAYLWSGARALLRNDHVQIRATVDGVLYERDCGLAMIVNVGALFGGMVSVGPGVRPDDGLLDLCLFSARTALEGFDVVRRCFARNFRPHRNMVFARGRAIRLESVPPTVAEADGELLGAVTLNAVVEPRAALLLRAQGRGAIDSL
jgi:diacylglycerol kinase family enzyme